MNNNKEAIENAVEYYKNQINQFLTIEEKKARLNKFIDEAEISIKALQKVLYDIEEEQI